MATNQGVIAEECTNDDFFIYLIMEDITIPKGYDAKIEGDKVVFVKKESEDEKIRKELIDILKKSYEFGGFTLNNKKDLDRYLSYFEEQKYKEKYDRMAPIYEDEESFESALDKAWKFYNDSGSSTVDGCEDNAFELAFAKGFREGFLCKESQKEQKPAEWSEKDRHAIGNCEYAIKETFKDEQNPYRVGTLDWLKSLRPQSRRKDTYYDIIHSILAMLKDLDFMQITPQHRVSLLNDIRVRCKDADECATILDEPRWKPSEEQMKALGIALRCGIQLGTWEEDALKSLYDKLKETL